MARAPPAPAAVARSPRRAGVSLGGATNNRFRGCARRGRWPPRGTRAAPPRRGPAGGTVTITTGRAPNVLVVPVIALLAQASSGYAVEVAGAGGRHHLVPVTTGVFDDAAGLVQVSGSGLHAGQRVVVPAL